MQLAVIEVQSDELRDDVAPGRERDAGRQLAGREGRSVGADTTALVEGRGTDELGARAAQNALCSGIDVDDRPARIVDDHALVQRVDHQPQPGVERRRATRLGPRDAGGVLTPVLSVNVLIDITLVGTSVATRAHRRLPGLAGATAEHASELRRRPSRSRRGTRAQTSQGTVPDMAAFKSLLVRQSRSTLGMSVLAWRS